jgi:histidine decarboxylase
MNNRPTKEDFYLPTDGLSEDERKKALRKLSKYLSKQKSSFLGYQANQALDHKKDLAEYLDFEVINLGDPFKDGNFTVNSKQVEQAVLDYYAELWNAHLPHDSHPRSYWGYVVSMGCTEANLYALWNARDYLAGKFLLDDPTADEDAKQASLSGVPTPVPRRPILRPIPRPAAEQGERRPRNKPTAYTPILFYSEDTHYSIIKSAIVLGLETFYDVGSREFPGRCPLPNRDWPKEVPSNRNGSIDIEALAMLVEFFAEEGYPILVSFNYGTTFKGAYDDVEAAGEALVKVFQRHGLYERKVYYDSDDLTRFDVRNGFWFHVDGALGAAYMPFIEMAYIKGQFPHRGPDFDFRLKFVHSISMSGHKWIGAPWPCGIYMTRRQNQLRPPDDPKYLGSPDSTFAGSRNGFSAMILWNYLAKNSYESQIQKALRTEEIAKYAYDRLKELQDEFGEDWWIEQTPLSLTVRFKKTHPDIIFKYSLSEETFYVNGQKRAYNHIFAMEHVTEKTIDGLINDLRKLGKGKAFPQQLPETNSKSRGQSNGLRKGQTAELESRGDHP